MSQDPQEQLTPEQLQQLEAEIDRITVDDVILQTIVSLINLGARKGAVGAPPDAGVPVDSQQLGTAIEAARALLAVVEPRHGDKLGPFKDALSQLQMAYAREARGEGAPTSTAGPSATPPQGPGEAAPGQGRSAAEDAERAKARAKIWTPGGR